MKKHCDGAEAFKYDGIKVEWTKEEKEKLDEIRKRNSQKAFSNGNGANQTKTSGTLPYIAIGGFVYGARHKWKHDLMEGLTDV